MKIGSSIVSFAIKRPKTITWVMVSLTLILALMAALPSLWPVAFPFLSPLKVDTDPENMLPAEEAVRIFHGRMKKEMTLYDMVVLGVVNDSNPEGVFNPESLAKIYELTEYAKTLRWPDEEHPGKFKGVIEEDIIAPSTVDNIAQAGPGTVEFEWLMPAPPQTGAQALELRKKAERIPFLKDTLISHDGKALCIYLPLTAKDQSYRVYSKLKEKIASFTGEEKYFVTGLPVAEDTFGVEMFKQMALSAPLAMLIIFLLMLFFFRKLILIISPMIVAMVAVIITMSLLIITGNTIHIMSSMIPIFIMPIAVLNSVHILSEFSDRYQENKDRRKTTISVMETLFTPMLYTSLTTAVGFGSLALIPIPPVQVFGIFIALGVMMAWFWTIVFIPAYIMFIPDKSLENFGARHEKEEDREIDDTIELKKHRVHSDLIMTWALGLTGRITYRHPRIVLAVVAIVVAVAIYGITQIQINDNPVKWFDTNHPIRVGDKVLNEHFAGTYMAYLALEAPENTMSPEDYAEHFSDRLAQQARKLKDSVSGVIQVFTTVEKEALRLAQEVDSPDQLLSRLDEYATQKSDSSPDEEFDAWDEVLLTISAESQRSEVFKQPAALVYIENLQKYLLTTKIVGKSNSLVDIVKTVRRELVSGEDKDLRIPGTAAAVGQCLLTFQNSHRPGDLWHFTTPDYRKSILWIQLKSGDNRAMSQLVEKVDQYISDNPPPFGVQVNWFGLTYINVIWQDKMVKGMLRAFLGSFIAVFLMMTLLYRSALWGMLAMIPLTVTILLIYGVIGLIGKDYDMPVAVLSSLSLGLAVDYAIHFLTRSRSLYECFGSWAHALGAVFSEPARAITRNVIVIGVGFLPLLLAPLVPYQTVGFFIAAILLTAGVATLVILPSLISLLEKYVFPETKAYCITCDHITCSVSGVALVALLAVNIQSFLQVGWNTLSWCSLGISLVLVLTCFFTSRRPKCRLELPEPEKIEEKRDGAKEPE